MTFVGFVKNHSKWWIIFQHQAQMKNLNHLHLGKQESLLLKKTSFKLTVTQLTFFTRNVSRRNIFVQFVTTSDR